MATSFVKPEEVLSELEIKETMTAVDFGCGAGGWVLPLAKRLEEGKVYAIDVQEEMISVLKGRAEMEGVTNIETIIYDLEDPEGLDLIDGFFDIVLITNLLFQIENKQRVLEEAKKVLKKGGQLLVIDWKKDSPLGPEEGRVSSEEAKGLAKEVGLELKKEFEAGANHYGLIFTKS